jgi:hypothetical protein
VQVTKAPPWHGWVLVDLFCSSLASGTFSVAALAILFGPADLVPAARIAFLIVFPVMLVDLVSLIGDLGDPLRFHHMLRVIKPQSAMSLGVWAISLFSFVAFLAFAGAALGVADSMMRAIGAAGLVPALVTSAYKGVLLSTTAQPVWRHLRWLGGGFTISAAAMGIAVMTPIAFALELETTYRAITTLFALLMVLNLIAMRSTFVGLIDVGSAQRRGTAVIAHRLVTYLGSLIPLVLVNPWASGSIRTWLAAATVLLSAVAFRWFIVHVPGLTQRAGRVDPHLDLAATPSPPTEMKTGLPPPDRLRSNLRIPT